VRPTLRLTAAVTPHAGQFLARCLEVDGLSACGSSVQAAVRTLAELQPPYPPHAFVVSLDIQLDQSAR
jgi:hypothetical protein